MHVLALRTVLVATDLEASSVVALETGRRLADAAGASLHVVHVAERSSPNGREASVASRDDVERATHALLQAAGLDALDAQFHLVSGEAAHAVQSLAERISANVVVLGPHRGRHDSGSNKAIGSTALAVVTNSAAPCLIVTRPLELPAKRIVVPVDLSDTARGGLVVALSWASALRHADNGSTSLTALHVSDDPTSTSDALERELQRIRADAGSWAGVSIQSEVIRGSDAPAAIAEFANEQSADLIVAGTRGLGLDAVDRLGSVSAELVRRVTSPLLLVPPAVWAAHVESQSVSGVQ